MKKTLFTVLCLFLTLTVILPPAQAQRKKKRRAPARGVMRAQRLPQKEYIASVLPGSGSITDGVYTNKYFGLELTLPDGRTVLDAETTTQLNQIGGELMAGDSNDMKSLMQEAQPRTLQLFTLTKLLPAESSGSAGVAPTSVMFIAVATPVSAEIFKTGEEYLDIVKYLLGQAALKSEFDGPVTKETMGGVEFATQRLHITHLGTLIRQKLSTTILKGHAVTMTRVYLNESGAEALDEVVRALKFK